MDLNDAEQYRQINMAQGERSDGCTFVPEIGHKCCQMHDFLRRFKPGGMPPADADRLFRECLQKKGYRITAWVYWAGVRIAGALRLYH